MALGIVHGITSTGGSASLMEIPVPSQSGTLTYNGSEQTASWNDYMSSMANVSNNTGTNAGTYYAYFSPVGTNIWEDTGDQSLRSVQWVIQPALIDSVPISTESLTYDGTAKSVIWSYQTTKINMQHITSTGEADSGVHTEAGTYYTKFTPTSNYGWSSEIISEYNLESSQSPMTLTWSIAKATIISVPTPGSLSYTGSPQTCSWSNVSNMLTSSDFQTAQTNVGTYSAVFTPIASAKWSDTIVAQKSLASNTSPMTVQWSIAKAPSSFTTDLADGSTINLTLSNITKTINVSNIIGDGEFTVTSSNANFDVAVTGLGTSRVITITGKQNTASQISFVIQLAGSANYEATSKSYVVVVDLPSKTLNENTPAKILEVAQTGNASTYWSIGDTIGPINLNGTVGARSFSNYPMYAYILGFNHNKGSATGKETINGQDKPSITFCLGRNASKQEIALIDSNYNTTGSSAGFRMNLSNSNSGGWNASYMRKSVCVQLFNALPADWRSVIATTRKYTDNVGGATNNASNISATEDQIFLMAEFEIFGARSYANSYEQNSQVQYDYYKANNTASARIRVSDSAQGSTGAGVAVYWWERSPSLHCQVDFAFVHTSLANGSGGHSETSHTRGFVPNFNIG